jgi:hypothetical protein
VLNKQFKFLNTNFNRISTKDKFFQSVKPSNVNYSFISKQVSLLSNNTKNKNSNGIFINNKNLNYIDLNGNVNSQVGKLTLIYKEVVSILFILNLIKLFEVYKTILNLIYLNIKI